MTIRKLTNLLGGFAGNPNQPTGNFRQIGGIDPDQRGQVFKLPRIVFNPVFEAHDDNLSPSDIVVKRQIIEPVDSNRDGQFARIVRMGQQLHTPSRLRAVRESKKGANGRKLTLEEAASHIGLTGTQLSKIERGEYPWHQKLLERAARYYGVPVVDLIEAPAKGVQDAPKGWDKLSKADKDYIQSLVDRLRPDKAA